MKKTIKRAKNGFKEAVFSTITGFIVTFIINTLVNSGWIPDYFLTLFAIFNIIGNILTVNKMRFWGIFYTVGWLVASLVFAVVFPDILSTLDIILNIMTPIIIFVVRFLFWVSGKVMEKI